MFEPRVYRNEMGGGRFRSFVVSHKETDLWVGVSGLDHLEVLQDFVRERTRMLRELLERYGEMDTGFFSAMAPYRPDNPVPPIVERMFSYGRRAQVGPMASVAGVFAQAVGEALRNEFEVDECIVENGGDIYLDIAESVTVSVFAGTSPLSGCAGLVIDPSFSPLGICTSSGTVGHSFSYGSADAVTVACKDPGLADAFATALANRVGSREDIDHILAETIEVPEILGTLIVVGDRMGIQGGFSLAMVSS